MRSTAARWNSSDLSRFCWLFLCAHGIKKILPKLKKGCICVPGTFKGFQMRIDLINLGTISSASL